MPDWLFWLLKSRTVKGERRSVRQSASRLAAIVVLLIAVGGGVSAQPVLPAVVADPAPVIDGGLSDPCWEKAPSVSDFYYTPDGTKGKEPTTAWICYDQKNIYAAFYCRDSQPHNIQAQQKKRGGGTYTDDRVDLGIACYPAQGHVAWFITTAGGVQDETFDWADVSKIEWRGDWKAAARRVNDGYIVEIAVPFSILQYNAGQTSLGICFDRRHARSDQFWTSPNVGATGDYGSWYLWNGLALPKPNTKPKLMAYSVLGTGSADTPQRLGLDVKHALTSSLTGLVTLNPYFDDVEQQVTSIDFSYNERYLPDSRPFFQEGEGYFPYTNILYTSRIGDIDAGAKVYGKIANYSLALMNVQKFGDESHTCLQVGREFGHDRSLYLCGVQSHIAGEDHLSTMISSGYRLIDKPDRKLKAYVYTIMADEPSARGALLATGLDSYAGPKKPQWGLYYKVIDDQYDPYLGYTPEKDLRGLSGSVRLFDSPSKGALSYWSTQLSWNLTDHLDGSLFHNSLRLSTTVEWRKGTGIGCSLGRTHRPPYRDTLINLYGWWGQRSLYNNGYAGLALGRQAGGSYLDYYVGRGWSLGDNLNLHTGYEYSRIEPPSPKAYSTGQLISTLAFDLDNERTLAGRLVAQKGKTNFYLAYKQRVRVGMDAYVIFGDPNADSTRSSLALKLIRLL